MGHTAAESGVALPGVSAVAVAARRHGIIDVTARIPSPALRHNLIAWNPAGPRLPSLLNQLNPSPFPRNWPLGQSCSTMMHCRRPTVCVNSAPCQHSYLTPPCDIPHCAYSRIGPASLCITAFCAAGSAGPPSAPISLWSDPLLAVPRALFKTISLAGGLHAAP